MFKRWAILYYADSRENPNSRIVHDFANALIVRMRNLGQCRRCNARDGALISFPQASITRTGTQIRPSLHLTSCP